MVDIHDVLRALAAALGAESTALSTLIGKIYLDTVPPATATPFCRAQVVSAGSRGFFGGGSIDALTLRLTVTHHDNVQAGVLANALEDVLAAELTLVGQTWRGAYRRGRHAGSQPGSKLDVTKPVLYTASTTVELKIQTP